MGCGSALILLGVELGVLQRLVLETADVAYQRHVREACELSGETEQRPQQGSQTRRARPGWAGWLGQQGAGRARGAHGLGMEGWQPPLQLRDPGEPVKPAAPLPPRKQAMGAGALAMGSSTLSRRGWLRRR